MKAGKRFTESMKANQFSLSQRYADAPKLYESGMTLKQCGDRYGITKEAMWEILRVRGVTMRRNAGSNSSLYRGGIRRSSKRMVNIVRTAVKNGVLRKKPCEVCGNLKSEAHHCDYNKPLDVMWLCDFHHFEWHRKNRAIELLQPLPKKTPTECARMGALAAAAKMTPQHRAQRSLRARAKVKFKLDWEKVDFIRLSKLCTSHLAELFSVSAETIQRVKNGSHWNRRPKLITFPQ